MKEKKLIKICSNHSYKVPLIWTFKFDGSEYWCPYCGFHGGMFGSGEDVKSTPILEARLKVYKRAASKFLSSDSNEGWQYKKRTSAFLSTTP